MIRKLFWILAMLFVLYILSIFRFPNLAKDIEKTLWIEWFNEFVISFKKTFEESITNFSKDEVIGNYKNILSWSIELKNKLIGWISTAKEKIDDLRIFISWVEKNFNKLKYKYNESKGFLEEISNKAENTKKTIDELWKLKETLTDSWSLIDSWSLN